MLVLGGFPRAYRRATDKVDELGRLIAPRGLDITPTYTYSERVDVRFGSKADHCKPNVCFGPKADMCGAHAVLFCSCCNTLIYEAGTVLHFYLLLLGQLCAFAHLLRLVTWHHLFWCSCLHLC